MAEDAPITPRKAVIALHLYVLQLLQVTGVVTAISDDVSDLSVTVNYRVGRIDIARLTPDGLHTGDWLCAFSISQTEVETWGTPLGLPGMDGQTH